MTVLYFNKFIFIFQSNWKHVFMRNAYGVYVLYYNYNILYIIINVRAGIRVIYHVQSRF